MNASSHADGFRPAAIGLILIIGVLGFVGMMVLGAYAPELGERGDAGTHALSHSAVGFAGIVRLLNDTGGRALVVRDDRRLGSEDLLVVTPSPSRLGGLRPIVQQRRVKPTLIVLPKWSTEKDRTRPSWVRYHSPLPAEWVARNVRGIIDVKVLRVRSGGLPLVRHPNLPPSVRFRAPRTLQTISGAGLVPLLTDGAGRIVLAQLGEERTYLLADPDLLSNAGVKNPAQAEAAIALLADLNSTGAETVQFDVTLDGLGRTSSLLRLAFDPPFLALTIGLAIAGLLAGFHGLGRFGAPRVRPRAIAFGKTALIDNTAAVVHLARREVAFGGHYAALIRERAAIAFRAPSRLKDGALDAYLDGIGGSTKFTDLAHQVEQATDRGKLVEAARALYEWEGKKA